MKFFRYFPTLNYTFDTGNTKFGLDITHPTAHVIILERVKQQITVFYDYVVSDGERPDSVATKHYGGPEYTWLVLVINGIMSHYDWPLTYDEFTDFIIDKYGSVVNAQNLTLNAFYKTTAGALVDSITYGLLPAADQGVIESAYDHEHTLNEAKRRIKVVPPEFVIPLTRELKQAFA